LLCVTSREGNIGFVLNAKWTHQCNLLLLISSSEVE